VLLANLVAVLHEQQRLQDAIAGALDAGLGETAKAIARGRLSTHTEHELAEHLGGLGRLVEDAWERALTEHVMTLTVAGEVLHLGRDVPALPDGRMFPDDWRVLGDRMNYIVNLFRSRQQYAPLFNDPA
jgi:hypothetical protein